MTHDEFNAIVIQYQEPVISIIYKMVYSWEVARDMAQESFLKLWKMQTKIRKNKPVFTLLYRIAINLCIDYLRRENKLSFQSLQEDSQIFDDQNEDPEFKKMLMICCSKLDPRQRAVFNLRDIEGLSFEEIADILDISIGNVRSNLHLARKNMRQILYKEYQIDQEYFNEM